MEYHTDVTLEFVNGEIATGVVVGANTDLDVACIQVLDQENLTALPMGDSDLALVGEEVLAMGYPLSDILPGSPTVTRGIISAKRPSTIQTDAAINRGGSGGPLVNSRGQVIGVNTSVLEAVAGRNVEGIGFAIPVNDVKEQFESLISGVFRSRSLPIEGEQRKHENWNTYLLGKGLSFSLPMNWQALELEYESSFFTDSMSFLSMYVYAEEVTLAYATSILADVANLIVEERQRAGIDRITWVVTDYGWEKKAQTQSYMVTFEGDREDGHGWRTGKSSVSLVYSTQGNAYILIAELDTPVVNSLHYDEIAQTSAEVSRELDSIVNTARVLDS